MTEAVQLAPGLRRVAPNLLVGGSPARLLRFSAAGSAALDALLTGTPHPGADALRARLLAAGVLRFDPAPANLDDLTVVIPAHCDADQVATVLAGLPATVPVIVVDDASPQSIASALPGRQVLRHDRQRGPAAARNAGAAIVTTDLIAFVDTDVELPATCLPRLVGHFRDPDVVAVAPRVRSRPASGWVGSLETELCALDLGSDAGVVSPGSTLAYVPAATLVVRRDAFLAIGGFDEELIVGEDVDFVWRLAALGRIHYDPSVSVGHGPRTSFSAALRRRETYGESAGPLDRRHAAGVRHLTVTTTTSLPWLAALLHPLAGAATAVATVALAPRRMPQLPPTAARQLAASSLWQQSLGIGRYSVRPGLPLTIAAAAGSRRVRRITPLLALSYLAASHDRLTNGPLSGLPRRAPAMLLDDLAYSCGVWISAVRDRRPRVVLPSWQRGQGRATQPEEH